MNARTCRSKRGTSTPVTVSPQVGSRKEEAMALSQCLDDSLLRSKPTLLCNNPQEVYNEGHRLALEELLSGGVDNFLAFLKKESIPNFLSDDEIQRIRAAAVAPRCVSFVGEDQAVPELGSSVDCSSVTYFPELSDVEPPPLEIGWPAFTAGSYRGVTRAVAHFQPSFGENIYACKDAARKMISSAKEVIAIVTDSLTDLDIFKDLQEACSIRQVPVYILLDQSSGLAFLKMCNDVGVRLDDIQQMRVRTITGNTYYTRSGARMTGKVHERFMLIDGNRVATGSYRFNWTDSKLNTSNLMELSGQITEKFDEQFRILYAQSLPINTRSIPVHTTTFDPNSNHLLNSSPFLLPMDQSHPTSTPARKIKAFSPPFSRQESIGQNASGGSNASTIGEDHQDHHDEILAAGSSPSPRFCHVSTQTNSLVVDVEPRSDPGPAPVDEGGPTPLAEERQRRYSTIRSKLQHVMSALSQRRELEDVVLMTLARHGVRNETLGAGLLAEN
ncbi:protein FAM83D [Stigmatopora nigra]